MKTFVVFVKMKFGSGSMSDVAARYIDSQWADEKHARGRAEELKATLRMFNVPQAEVELLTGMVQDATISIPELAE